VGFVTGSRGKLPGKTSEKRIINNNNNNFFINHFLNNVYSLKSKKKVKLSHYMTWRHMGGEEV
jgi:hypothetical protein